MKRITIIAAWVTALALAGPAFAHSGGEGHTHGLLNGLQHPITGVDHVLAMLGVGIWSALAMPANRVLLAPFAFIAAMLAGAAAGIAGVAFSSVEAGVAVSVVAIGLMILSRIRVPAALAAILIGAFGVMHGYAHGAEAEGGIAAYMAGFTITTATLHLTGIGLGRWLANSTLATRTAGAAMALAGVSLLVA
jgi:urease accessory protein